MSLYSGDKGYQAFRILQIALIIPPILAGLDKFLYSLTNWCSYISPFALQILHGHVRGFMMIVGAFEIVVGIGILFKPKIFAYLLALWLLCIIINLLMTGHYFDIALRDFGLFLSAVALGRLSQKYAA